MRGKLGATERFYNRRDFTSSVAGAGAFQQASMWGSILPAVWSFMLALRSRGLGSAGYCAPSTGDPR